MNTGSDDHAYLSTCCGGSAQEPWGIQEGGTGYCAKCHEHATFTCECGQEA